MRIHMWTVSFLALSLAAMMAGCQGGDVPDTTAPTVISTYPTAGSEDVPINSKVTVTFSEAMNPITLTTTTFTVKAGATPVAGTVTYADNTATFIPTSLLSPNTTFTATIFRGAIPTGVHDLVCNTLASDYVWTFKTSTPVTVAINPDTVTIPISTTQQFTVVVANTANTLVNWSVVENGGGTITANGLYTAPVIAGTYHIKATSAADLTKSDLATVTVQSGNTIITVN